MALLKQHDTIGNPSALLILALGACVIRLPGDDGGGSGGGGSSVASSGGTGESATGEGDSTGGAATGGGSTSGGDGSSTGLVECETEGGKSEEWLYSCCIVAATEGFTTCETWCLTQGWAGCAFVEVFDAYCGPIGEGDNVLGQCAVEVFSEWNPEAIETARIRCACGR